MRGSGHEELAACKQKVTKRLLEQKKAKLVEHVEAWRANYERVAASRPDPSYCCEGVYMHAYVSLSLSLSLSLCVCAACARGFEHKCLHACMYRDVCVCVLCLCVRTRSCELMSRAYMRA